MKESAHFFLGSNTPQGFYSLFDGLYDPYSGGRCYILKGGPGTGKSTFMKRVAESAANCSLETECINCASDPHSLDAVIIKEKNVCVVDGTAPHIIEPVLPGVSEQLVDLGEYWDSRILLKNREKITQLNGEYRQCHARAVRFLKGAAVLEADTARVTEQYTDIRKIEICADRLVRHETGKRRDKTGTEVRKFISVITPEGVFLHADTLNRMCDKIIGIEGIGSVPGRLLKEICGRITDRGYDVISCPSFMQPDAELMCVIVPSERLAFIKADENTLSVKFTRIIHTSRFTDNEMLSQFRSRIKFNKRLYDELTGQAADSLCTAKQIHDRLEEIYMGAMNFKKCEKRCDAVISQILKMPNFKTE
ncbi:MAG: hypothetical protein MJ177_03575 [Clostridia bacterium]|nr:hypothetical protein [Clostridia bacterium]